MDTPAAEVDLDDAIVAGLLHDQQPDLAHLPLKLIANGWDNAVYRLGDDLCLRLPRRAVAVPLIRTEQRWLSSIAKLVGTPIPVPLRVGEPSGAYPWPWTITGWFRGDVASDLPVERRGRIAEALAGFMNRLHVAAPAGAPVSPVRGVPLMDRHELLMDQLDSGVVPQAGALRELWYRLIETPQWTNPPVWVHGDPHPANLLVHRGELAAVLDFGDLNAGDPATDLACAWLTFDAPARAAFRRHLAVDEATWLRGRAWGLALGSAFVCHSDDNPAMAAIGHHALAQVLSD